MSDVLFQPPLFEPEGDWRPPTDLPDLGRAKLIAVDVETCDPDLKEKGPGGVRGDGHLAGVSLATDDGFKCYLPIKHGIGQNMDFQVVQRWLKAQLGRPNQPKVGANFLYDLEWLAMSGVPVKGTLYDVQVAEPLIDENQFSFGLDELGRKWLGQHKDERLLREAVAAYFGAKADPKSTLWQLPAKFVGPYAESDAELTLKIFEQQCKRLRKNNLWDVFMLETRLTPMLLAMRLKGTRVDLEKAEQLRLSMNKHVAKLHAELKRMTGFYVNVWSNDSLEQAFKAVGERHPYTARGKASFVRVWLEHNDAPIAQAVMNVRRFEKLRDTFVKGQVLEENINGRIYTQFHQLRADDYGTRSGRFSSSNPNLQQVPSRDKELAPLVRGLFVPEEGKEWWSADYSQIEFRMLVHYAALMRLERADVAQRMYREDYRTDFHEMASKLTGVERKQAKNLNFGLAYGMGIKKLAKSLGLTEEDTRPIFQTYHERLPFLKLLSEACGTTVQQRGWIQTIAGRRRRFPLWEPAYGNKHYRSGSGGDGYTEALERDAALARYGQPLRRAHTHKALNALIQGGAADMMKAGMVKIWESGVCDVIGVPTLTVHDELDGSVNQHDSKEREAMRHLIDEMKNAIPLNIPVLVDFEIGPDWGHVSSPDKTIWEGNG